MQPAGLVLVEQIALDHAAGGFVGRDADKTRALVGAGDGALGELAADLPSVRGIAAGGRFPHLLLARVVVGDGESHELLEVERVVGVKRKELRRDGSKLQALPHHCRVHEEARGDLVLAQPLLAQIGKGAELIERMERHAMDILRKRIFLGKAVRADETRDRLRLVHALLLDEALQGAEAPPAGRHFIHAGRGAFGIQHRTDAQALQEAATRDVLGELLDREARLDAADVRLGEDELVEGNVLGLGQDDLRCGFGHGEVLHDGPAGDFSQPSVPSSALAVPLPLGRRRPDLSRAPQHRGSAGAHDNCFQTLWICEHPLAGRLASWELRARCEGQCGRLRAGAMLSRGEQYDQALGFMIDDFGRAKRTLLNRYSG